MKQWLRHARLFFGDIANTLEKHWPEIANYFLNKTTSGVKANSLYAYTGE